MLQNEINLNELIIKKAIAAGMNIAMNFAPFDAAFAKKFPFQHLKILIVNEHEGADLSGTASPEKTLNQLSEKYPNMIIVITLGSKGAIVLTVICVSKADSPVINAVDTTCAGDTFIGYFIEAYLNKKTLDAV